jgi:transposase
MAQLVRKALRSRIEPLRRFARNLRPYLSGIPAHCRWPLRTNLVEGINNKIKVIRRMAYGFRDDAYFFLKIRAAFSWVGLKNQKRTPAGLRHRSGMAHPDRGRSARAHQ